MQNAHQRLAKVKFVQESRKVTTSVEVWCDRFAFQGSNTLMLSIFGNSTEVAAVSAAISLEKTLHSVLPDGTRGALFLGKDAVSYRSQIQLPGRTRPVQHQLFFSQAMMNNGSDGTVYCLQSDTTLLWSTMISCLGLPACPVWAHLGVKMLRSKGLLQPLGGFGCDPVAAVASRDMLLEWIGEQVRLGALSFPSIKGPIKWPKYTVSDLLHGPKPSIGELVAEAVGF